MQIRTIEVKDAKKFLEMMSKLDFETKNMLLEPGERTTDLHKIKGMIKEKIAHNDLFLIAEEEETIVGVLTIDKGRYKRISHSGYLVTGIRSEYQGKGIGSNFFRIMDIWALKNNITRIELTVIKTNEVAIHLYQKYGFEIEGIKKNSMIIDGQYVDEYYMAKLYC